MVSIEVLFFDILIKDWMHQSVHPRMCSLMQEQGVLFFVAHIRARRLHAQTTHVLAECIVHETLPDGGVAVSLKHLPETPRIFSFWTLWLVAKHFLLQGAAQLFVTVCSQSPSGTYHFASAELRDSERSFQVWPTTFRRAPTGRRASVGRTEILQL